MRRPLAPRGFSLVELLMVMSIIGLLVALLVPGVQSVRETARKVQCANNLWQIGRAYTHYTTKSSRSALRWQEVATWTSVLSPYLDEDKRPYKCPDDRELTQGSNLSGYYYHAYASRVSPKRTFDGVQPYSAKWDMDGPFICDDNTPYRGMTFRQAIKTRGTYPFDPAPGAYVFSADSACRYGAGDNCCEDIYFVVDPNCPAGARAACWFVEWTPGDCPVMLGDQVVIGYDRNGTSKPLAPPKEGDWWQFQCEPCSYGINSRVFRFTQDSDRVLAVEYCKLVADLSGMTASDLLRPTDSMKESSLWSGWGGGRARHTGMLNTLFGDGRVEARAPITISPALADLNQRFWQPYVDQK